MARLTLSEQVNAQASRIAELTAELHNAQGIIATHIGTIERQQGEVHSLRQQAVELPGLREQIAKLTKERDDAKNMQTYYSASATKAENELEQAHAVLDGVDGAPAREYEMEYGKGQRNVVTRLAGAFLAIAKNGGAK